MLAGLRGACGWLASCVHPGPAARALDRGALGPDRSRRANAAKLSLATGLAVVLGLPVATAAQTNGLRPVGDAEVAGTACTSTLYLSQLQGNPNTTLFEVNTRVSPLVFDPLGSGSHLYNALGFNPVDNQLYAMNTGGSVALNMLLQVAADGATTELGIVSGLPAVAYNSGTVGSDGVYYVKPFGNTNVVYAIDVGALTATAINLSTSFTASDMGWVGGAGGSLYSVSDAGQLYSISVAGTVTAIGAATGGGVLGAQFGAVNGLFGSSNDGGLFRIDLTSGARTLISGSPASGSNDGANCPNAPVQLSADLSVDKTSPTTTYTPGASVSYTIVVTNDGPFPAEDVTVSDPLPTGITSASWTCSGTGGGVCGAASGTGAIDDTDVVLPAGGSVTYALTLQVPTGFTGSLVNTASVVPGVGTFDPDGTNDSDSVTHTGGTVEPGICDSTLYLSQLQGNPNTTLFEVNTRVSPLVFDPLGSGSHLYNALGFNPVDNQLYAMNTGGSAALNMLLRVATNGATTELGVVSGLPAVAYNSGTVGSDGVYYVKPFGNTNVVYAIDVGALTATAINLSTSFTASDMGWVGGAGGSLYSVSDAGQLYSISAAGTVTAIGAATGGGVLGAQFGAVNGLFGSSNDGGLFRIDLTSGARTLISGSPASGSNDGANCPNAPVQLSADLSVDKTSPTTTYTPGSNVSYTIVVTNDGPFPAEDVSVSDPLPTGITSASWTCSGTGGGVCGAASGTGAIADTDVVLPVGGSVTYALTLQVPSGFTGPLVNAAAVVPGIGTFDPDPSNDNDQVTHTPGAAVPPTLVKVLTSESGGVTGTAEPGETLVYTITLSNGGVGAFTDYAFDENIPPGATLTAVTGAGVSIGCTLPLTGSASCPVSVASVPAGGSTAVSVTFVIDDPIPAGVTSIVNSVSGGDTTCGAAGNACSVTTPVAGGSVVSLTKTVTDASGNGIAEPGETLTYQITLTNTGSSAATGYDVTDPLDPNTSFVSATNGGAHAAGVITWTGLTVPAQVGATPGTLALTVAVTVNTPIPSGVTRIVNQAMPTGTTPPNCAATPTPAGCAIVPTPSNIRLVKALTGETGSRPGLAEPGETLTYTITLTDLGGGGFANYAFVENVPLGAALTAVGGAGVTAACGLPVSGIGSCPVTVASVPAGGSTTVLVTFVVADPVPAGVTAIVNTVNQGDTGCAVAGNACSVSTAVAGAAAPEVVAVPVNSRLALLLLALSILAIAASASRSRRRFER